MQNHTTSGLTVLIPAYNEAANIRDTLLSLQAQTVRPDEIIVIDDFSTDGTGDIARACGVTVLRPPANSGSKASAQNFALPHVHTPLMLAIDADTTLAPDAIEKLIAGMDREDIAACCGFVIPRHVRTIWERGRYIEYLFAFSFYKQIQDYYEKPLIASGCFSVYRTEILKAHGGWSTRTLAEDMDLTWTFYLSGLRVRFVPSACCYPVEPHDFNFMRKQLRRWSHGFVQNLRVHWRGVLDVPVLRMIVGVALWDATIASVAYLLLVPLLAIFVNPLFLLLYVIDLPAVLVPVFLSNRGRSEPGRVLLSLGPFLVLRVVNAVFLLGALWCEFVVNRPLRVFEKGH